MIYSNEDRMTMNRLLLRRSVEFASSVLRMDPDSVRDKMWVDILARQIDGIQALVAFAENRVENVASLLDTVKNNLVAPPPRMISDYMSGLTEQDLADEGALIGFIQIIGAHMPLLDAADALASKGPNSDLTLKDSDSVLCTSVRTIMQRVSERADGQDPEVLGGFSSYMLAIDALCSAVISVHSGRSLVNERLSSIVDALDAVEESDFDRLFLDAVDDEDRRDLDSFRSQLPRYIAAMYARIILNCRYPMSVLIGRSQMHRCWNICPTIVSICIHL